MKLASPFPKPIPSLSTAWLSLQDLVLTSSYDYKYQIPLDFKNFPHLKKEINIFLMRDESEDITCEFTKLILTKFHLFIQLMTSNPIVCFLFP